MKKYLFFVLLTVIIESLLITGTIFIWNTAFPETMFFGSLLFLFISFIISSSGGFLSNNAEFSVFASMAGNYKPRREESYLIVSPFLVGSFLFFISYFVIYYFVY